MQFGYAFDDIGNRTSATTNGRQADYTANLLNEYTEATVPGAFDVLGTANPAATLTINRAAVPNRTGSYYWKTLSVNNTVAPVWQEVKVVGVRKNAGPDDKDVVTESVGHEFVPQAPEAFAYDDDGNLTSDGRWAYTWDGENRLVKMEAASGLPAGARKKVEFAYDGQSRRIEKKVYVWDAQTVNWSLFTDHLFLYDGWNLIAELNANDLSLVRKYCWGLDLSGSLQGAGGVGGLLSLTSGSATQLTAYDGNGNVVALIDAATGTEAARYEYDPFGNTLVQTGLAAAGNPFRFSTKYTDSETGLLYYGYRYYSPRLGRWASRDPLGEALDINVYRFSMGDALSRCDYLGWGTFTIAEHGFTDSEVTLGDLITNTLGFQVVYTPSAAQAELCRCRRRGMILLVPMKREMWTWYIDSNPTVNGLNTTAISTTGRPLRVFPMYALSRLGPAVGTPCGPVAVQLGFDSPSNRDGVMYFQIVAVCRSAGGDLPLESFFFTYTPGYMPTDPRFFAVPIPPGVPAGPAGPGGLVPYSGQPTTGWDNAVIDWNAGIYH